MMKAGTLETKDLAREMEGAGMAAAIGGEATDAHSAEFHEIEKTGGSLLRVDAGIPGVECDHAWAGLGE